MDSRELFHFLDLQSDFYHYMITIGALQPKTSRDYLTRLRFLAEKYRLDESITVERIEEILSEEEKERTKRIKYSTKHAMSDFRSGLMKFYNFTRSNYKQTIDALVQAQEERVEKDVSIGETQKRRIINARIGQGFFREQLIGYWNGCSLSGCKACWLLAASHIKPWRDSNNEERLDVYNGLLLMPNYDKLFDLGYISFSNDGTILISKEIDKDTRQLFNLKRSLSLRRIDARHLGYLKYHNENRFLI